MTTTTTKPPAMTFDELIARLTALGLGVNPYVEELVQEEALFWADHNKTKARAQAVQTAARELVAVQVGEWLREGTALDPIRILRDRPIFAKTWALAELIRGKEDGDRLFTTHGAARALQVNPSTVRRWIDGNLLTATRTPGGHQRIPLRALREFARAQGLALRESVVREVLS